MKTLILTTNTNHHLFFIKKLNQKFKNIDTVFEKRKNNFKFKIWHNYISKRDKFEKKFFFNNKLPQIKNLKVFTNVNSKKSIEYISYQNPDVIISFGIGLMGQKFLKKFKEKKIINLHGGNPIYYRGLDSLLWSLYHKDFKNLISTLHYVDKKFDTGKIIYQRKIVIKKDSRFEHLRALNTVNCINMVMKYLSNLKRKKKIKSIKQSKVGRCYSAIPSVLIDQCKKNYKILLTKLN